MSSARPSGAAARRPRPVPPEERLFSALDRLARERALQTLVRGALPSELLRRLFRGAVPRKQAEGLAAETWSALAVTLAMESADSAAVLAQALHDRLAWDREPASPDEWERAGRERPLEALWMAALSESKAVRKTFAALAADWLRAYRASPECAPPSWEFVEGVLDVQAQLSADLGDVEKEASDLTRRYEAERQRSEDLREELKKLRRENSELRAEKAQAEKRAAAAAERAASPMPEPPEVSRLAELERRLRKAQKESEHLRRELERARPRTDGPVPAESVVAPAEAEAAENESGAGAPNEPRLSEDPNAHRRVMRQMLRKLFKKGKIGASHTHEDNVYRGVPDHEKGTAKQIMDLLYREGLMMPKPTATDPHVSLNPERTAEVRSIIAGDIRNPRLRRFVDDAE